MWGYPAIIETLYAPDSPTVLSTRLQSAVAPVKKGFWQRQPQPFQGAVSADAFNITRRPFSNKFSPPQIAGLIKLAPDGRGSVVELRYKEGWETTVVTGILSWFMILFLARFVTSPEAWSNELIRFVILFLSAVVSVFFLVCAFWFDVWLSRIKLMKVLRMTATIPL